MDRFIHLAVAAADETMESAGIGDDEAFTESLARRNVFVFPGVLFETPGFFRISLTANDDMIERSLPALEAAMKESMNRTGA